MKQPRDGRGEWTGQVPETHDYYRYKQEEFNREQEKYSEQKYLERSGSERNDYRWV